jgi:allantoinase
MKLRSHGRYDFNPLPSRPAGCWPGGARLAFHVALNLLHCSFGIGPVEDLVPSLAGT